MDKATIKVYILVHSVNLKVGFPKRYTVGNYELSTQLQEHTGTNKI